MTLTPWAPKICGTAVVHASSRQPPEVNSTFMSGERFEPAPWPLPPKAVWSAGWGWSSRNRMRKEHEEMQETCQAGFVCYFFKSGNKCSLAHQLRSAVLVVVTALPRPEHPLPVWQHRAAAGSPPDLRRLDPGLNKSAHPAGRYFLRCPHARRHTDRSHPSLPF